MEILENPYRPGPGTKPPYLAGRQDEQLEFLKLINTKPIFQNFLIKGRRGVGKTSLLESLKPLAISKGWLWCGTDLSESASISEKNLSNRIITDIASATSSFPAIQNTGQLDFFPSAESTSITANYQYLNRIYDSTPGLSSDKLKMVLEVVWNIVKSKATGIILAYDEAQILKDQKDDKEFPLSLLLEVIQYLQRKEIPYLLVLSGLPTLLGNLVETRTYAERMFHVVDIDRLSDDESELAIKQPLKEYPLKFSDQAVKEIISYSGGYAYFIQFLCRETFDSYIYQQQTGNEHPAIFLEEIVRKLDNNFYMGRWSKVPERPRDLMRVIAKLPNAEKGFSAQEILEKSNELKQTFKASNINQLLIKLIDCELVYKNRHGWYMFAVPMLSEFINRQ
jgi:AAA+ ATPase superfamily predicted ATPase